MPAIRDEMGVKAMRVIVEYAAQYKSAAGVSSEELTFAGPVSVVECIRHVAEARGNPLRGLLLEADGSVHPSTLAFVGGRQVRWDEPLELRDGDVVTLLAPISGG